MYDTWKIQENTTQMISLPSVQGHTLTLLLGVMAKYVNTSVFLYSGTARIAIITISTED